MKLLYKGQEVKVSVPWNDEPIQTHFAIVRGMLIGLIELTWMENKEQHYGYVGPETFLEGDESGN